MFRKTLKEEEESEGGGDAAPAPVVPDPRISLAPFAPVAHLPPPTQPNDTGIASVSSALAELSVTPSPSHKTTAKKPSRSPQSAARSAHKQASPAPPTASDAPSPFAPFTATASPPVPAPLFSFNLSSSESLPPPNASMFAALAPPPMIPASPFTFATAAGQPQVGQPPMPVPIPMFAAKSPAAAPKAGAKPKPEPAPKLEERRVLRLARAKAAPSQEVTNQRCAIQHRSDTISHIVDALATDTAAPPPQTKDHPAELPRPALRGHAAGCAALHRGPARHALRVLACDGGTRAPQSR